MASKTAILSVRILGDAKGAISAMGEVEGRSSKLGGIVKGAGGIIAGAAAAGGAALVGLGAAGVMAAGDLEQSIGAVDSVFKGSADQVHAFANTAATELGLTGNEYRELATLMGTQLKNGGTALEDLGGKTHELMGLGADLSSMFGGSTTDAVSAISSALSNMKAVVRASVTAAAAIVGALAYAGRVGLAIPRNASEERPVLERRHRVHELRVGRALEHVNYPQVRQDLDRQDQRQQPAVAGSEIQNPANSVGDLLQHHRLEWCEHELARVGLIVMGQRGQAKNPMTTIAGQYRVQLKTYIRELGLSPSARTGIPAGMGDGEDDEDDIFD